ncbi:hypothetical protein NQZ79_g7259 [Umbelopsis isabellina]|nr:hypothetical protein NQZ79_g7259 [Umbelopsis isabellina]
MVEFTLVAPEPLRFSNSPAESICHSPECSQADLHDESIFESPVQDVCQYDQHSFESSAYTEFQEIFHSSRYCHRENDSSQLGLISKLVESLREHVPASPVPRSHNPLPNNATFSTLSNAKRASSCTPSVLSSTFEGYSIARAF